jgi:hypothetical protein
VSKLIDAVLMMALPGFMCGNRGLREIEHRVDVDFESQLPLLVGNVLDFLKARLMGCIVDENVDPAELGHRFVDNRAAMPGILDVSPDKDNPTAAFLDEALGFSGILVLVQVSDQQIRSFPGKGDCDGTADVAVAAGYDRFLSSET